MTNTPAIIGTRMTGETESAQASELPRLVPHVQHNTEARSIAMRFWARSIGDRNPRHVTESNRSQTGGAGFVAHPCWLYSVQDTIVDIGTRDTCPIVAGTDWRFRKPVVIGDSIRSVVWLEAESRKKSRFAGTALLQTIKVHYLDAHGDEIAQATSRVMRVSPEAARRVDLYREWKRWKYTSDELARIERGYDDEVVRGDVPRYWEDVVPGMVIEPIVRGPLSSEEVVLFVGATHPIPSMAAFTRELAAGRATGFVHPRTGAYESYSAGLIDDESARQLGHPAAHDYGIDRISQMGSHVVNWMGDAGQLMTLNARLIEPNMFGDTTWFSGRVTGKRDCDGGDESPAGRNGLVDIETLGTNQRGAVTVRGTATVALPRRSAPRARSST